MKRIAFYGGSFDPIHRGHLKIAEKLLKIFELDEFIFVPAFHAPHKLHSKPESAYHRYAMLCLATKDKVELKVSKMELDVPEKSYTVETLMKILKEKPDDEIYFVMGADSWEEITSWKEWKKVLTIVNIIVVMRPGYEITLDYFTDEILQRIGNLREKPLSEILVPIRNEKQIFITDAAQINISSTKIREAIRKKKWRWRKLVPADVVNYIEKYNLYRIT